MKLFAVLMVCALAASGSAAELKPSKSLRSEVDVSKMTGISFLGLSEGTKVDSKAQHASAMAVASKVTGGMDSCQNCVYVLERIKQGYQYLLPSICVEIFSKEGEEAGKTAYGVCHQVLASLSVWGNNVRHWLHYGCYKAESYGAMELIRPCPSHIICSQMADFSKKSFCEKVPQDKLKAPSL